jgi:hypothetical protein
MGLLYQKADKAAALFHFIDTKREGKWVTLLGAVRSASCME